MDRLHKLFINAIKSELESYKSKNTQLSNRSFCSKYSIDNGDLSKVLNGKKLLSPEVMITWLNKLEFKIRKPTLHI